jgi:non-specific serine/threonine protein kinase/serine/threonine-protein kinase
MTVDFDKLRDVFHAAAELHGPAERDAYLDQACAGDEDLRREAARLLKAHAEGQGPLDQTPFGGHRTGMYEATVEVPGTLIGPYKLLEQIGEGGFGVVFLAEQQQPVRRKVALKVIKPGMDTHQVVARFEAERQALALMDHPNIAKVLDGGETPPAYAGGSPRPYFVMDLVKGIPITEYCDQNQLTPRERLDLFIPVCQAVQHAHQKGIIHRDIKPSNVLISRHDATPVVKVIDFGIAKALGQQLTDKTLFTNFAQLIGTPPYMSPEQAGMSDLDVDTRSDIYSLGVLLYELLTGTTPFDKERLKKVGYDEMRRIIREEEPPKPSTRISTLGQVTTTVCARRKSDPKRLGQALRGELDWIVMKCLEKDRNRRYETASALAADVQRYLNDEAVVACPPSAGYRLRKFVRRNKVVVLTTTTVAVALLTGSAVATWQAVRATQAEAAALTESDKKDKALAAEAVQRGIAEGKERVAKQREADTRAVLDFFEKMILAAARPPEAGGLGHDVTLRRALEVALAAVETRFKGQPSIEAHLRYTLGESFEHLGDDKVAAGQYARALELWTRYLGPDHFNTLHGMNNLAGSYLRLGRPAEALKLFDQALAITKAKHGADHPDTLTLMMNVAACYRGLGRYREALKRDEETAALRKARLGPDHPDTLDSMNNVAIDYAHLNRQAEALGFREDALKLAKARFGPEDYRTLPYMYNLANSYHALDQHAKAATLGEQTLDLCRTKLGPDHPDTLETMHLLANCYTALGRHDNALKLRAEMLARRKTKFGPDHPDTLASMADVAWSLVMLARGAEAVPVIDECVRRAPGKPVHPQLLLIAISLRLRHFQKTKDAAGCRATAEMWERLQRTDAQSLYAAACMRAVTAAVIREGKLPRADAAGITREQADRAVAWLRQAVAAGFKNSAQMKQDKDLEALRNREDFQQLLAQMEAKK